MFNTVKIGKKIKEARLAGNLTQMNLADAMGVSYQAVSNWERGNSMPDIGKLEELCTVLGIGVEELLGIENPETKAVSKVIGGGEELDFGEIAKAAPVLRPEQVREETEKARKKGGKKVDFSVLADMAPFLDDEYIEELLEDCAPGSMEGFDEVAPFLSSGAIDRIAERAQPGDVGALLEAAPFLSEAALEHLVDIAGKESLDGLVEAAPFMGEEALQKLADKCAGLGCTDMIPEIAPFCSKDGEKKLAERLFEGRWTKF